MTHEEVMAALRALLKRPVAYHRAFAKIGGGATAGLMLSQAWYWSSKVDEDGWFFKSQEEWEEETGLTRTEQETARRNLRERGLIEEKRAGMPARLYFRVNAETLFRLLAENPQTRLQESRNQERGKPADKIAENGQPFNRVTETTSETTAERRARAALKTFSDIYGHEAHLPGQAEIEAEALKSDFDPDLWRETVRQCKANLTPAKNVGTMLTMYRERKARGSPRAVPKQPSETAAAKSKRLEDELRARQRHTA